MHSHSHAHAGSQCHHGDTCDFLKWSSAATVVFVVVEVIAGIRSGSLALLSDAVHNLTDALASLFTWFAFYLQSKPANQVKTYGYHRTGVLAAFVNALTLVALSVWIFYEGIQRLLRPAPVPETIILGVAGLGPLLNGGILRSLRL